ncbi:hydrolase [Lithospermum erythrorhizon]|uniref:Hydrolase n=1 Tax=Lithospermum erythrorhizon TaxID=34254 RepID=A0AAV3PBJ3_LITER
MFRQGVTWALVVLVWIWLYKSFIPPPPKICGTPGGPPITGSRILLRDGRHLCYEEYGVPKPMAKYKTVYIHGHGVNKRASFLTTPGFFEEFEVYIVGFDRLGYGESDSHPERTLKSSLGWGCIKYISHRLAGVILIAPAINFWWPSLPIDLVEQDFH